VSMKLNAGHISTYWLFSIRIKHLRMYQIVKNIVSSGQYLPAIDPHILRTTTDYKFTKSCKKRSHLARVF